MKSYSILMSAALAACSFTGCGDFLDIKPLNDIVLENFWDEKSDVDNMISGCYSTMQVATSCTVLWFGAKFVRTISWRATT